MKVGITVYDKNDEPAVILEMTEENGLVSVHVCYEDAEVSLDDLKSALRKLSAK